MPPSFVFARIIYLHQPPHQILQASCMSKESGERAADFVTTRIVLLILAAGGFRERSLQLMTIDYALKLSRGGKLRLVLQLDSVSRLDRWERG